MKQNDNRGELLIAGVGGWGIVTIGNILADAAQNNYEHIAWFPSYATMMRGGETECCIIFSHERISSPIIYKSSGIMILGASRIEAFRDRVKPGGTLIIETTGVNDENRVTRDDVNIRYISAIDEAIRLGNVRNANLVMLGAYIGITGLVPKESVLERIELRFGGKGKEKVVATVQEAFLAGVELA